MADDNSTQQTPAVAPAADPSAVRTPPATPPPAGLLSHLASYLGIDPDAVQTAAKAFYDHPVQAAEEVGSQVIPSAVASAKASAKGIVADVTDPEKRLQLVTGMVQPGESFGPEAGEVEGGLRAKIHEMGEAARGRTAARQEASLQEARTGKVIDMPGAPKEPAAAPKALPAAPEAVKPHITFEEAGGAEVAPPRDAETSVRVADLKRMVDSPNTIESKNAQALLKESYGIDAKPGIGATVSPEEASRPLDTSNLGQGMSETERAMRIEDLQQLAKSTNPREASAAQKILQIHYGVGEDGEPTGEAGAIEPQFKNALASRNQMPDQTVNLSPAGSTYVGHQLEARTSMQNVQEQPGGKDFINNLFGTTTGSDLLPMPKRGLDPGQSPESVISHEMGHALELDRQGEKWNTGIESHPTEIMSHLHPDLKGGATAGVMMPWDKVPGATLGKNGNYGFTSDALKAVLPDLLHVYLAGSAFQNLTHGTPLGAGVAGDSAEVSRFMRAAGFTEDEAENMIAQTHANLRQQWNNPDILNLIRGAAAGREEGLSKTLHMSAERLQNIRDRVRQIRQEASSGQETSNTPASAGAGSAISAATGQPGGAGLSTEGNLREGNGEAVSPVAESRKVAPLPPQPKLPETGQYAAVQTDDGGIYPDMQPEKQRTHIMLAQDLGIPPERVTGGGWLKNGVYEDAGYRSDAGRWGEQARAKIQATANRVSRTVTTAPTNELTDAAVKKYGVTDNPTKMGFILPDGRGLDFSEGRPARTLDHGDVSSILPRKGDNAVAYNENPREVFSDRTGAARILIHRDGVNIVLPESGMTPEQSDVVLRATEKHPGDVTIDIRVKGKIGSASGPVEDAEGLDRLVRDAKKDARTPGAGTVSVRPNLETAPAKSVPEQLTSIANKYQAANGREPLVEKKLQVDPRQEQMADAYAAAVHAPNDPAVKKSYDALKRDIDEQYDRLVNAGFSLDTRDDDPYEGDKLGIGGNQSGAETAYQMMRKDLVENKHLSAWKGGAPPADHPLSAVDPKTGLTYNEKFRLVHDVFGHVLPDNDFSAAGEESAWGQHRQMFSPEALPALATETRAQTAYVTKHGQFSDQKAAIMPKEFQVRPEDMGQPESHKDLDMPPWWNEQPDAAIFKGNTRGGALVEGAKENGGFTVHPRTGAAPTDGYQLETFPERRVELTHAPTSTDIRSFIAENRPLLNQHPELYVGGYDNKKTGKYELNISGRYADKATAVAAANKLDQISIWDNKNQDEIFTKGSGKTTQFPDYPLEDRLKDLRTEPETFAPGKVLQSKPSGKQRALDEISQLGGWLSKSGRVLPLPEKDYDHGAAAAVEGLGEGKPGDEHDSYAELDALDNGHIRVDRDDDYVGVESKKRPTDQQIQHIATILKNSGIRQLTWDLGASHSQGSIGDFQREIDKQWPPTFAPGKVLQSSPGSGDRVSSRFPTAVRATEDPMKHDLTLSVDDMYKQPAVAQRIADKIVKQNKSMVFTPEDLKSPKGIFDKFMQYAEDNQVATYEHARDRGDNRHITNRVWYDGAHEFGAADAKRENLQPRQTWAVTATQSPQKDWNQNVSLYERILDTVQHKNDVPFTPEMTAKGKEFVASIAQNNAKRVAQGKHPVTPWVDKALIKALQGKSLADLSDPTQQAAWVRLYDEAHNPREFRDVNADGTKGDVVKTAAGEPEHVAWGGLSSIAKAISILHDGSLENISKQLGQNHKVRSFYNNIAEPNSPHGDVTADTHHVGLSLMRPVAGDDPETKLNFGENGSSITGTYGTYPLYVEATRRAVQRINDMHPNDPPIEFPRQLQSVDWVEWRQIFPPDSRTEETKSVVNSIWKEHLDGKITADQARKQVFDYAAKLNSGVYEGAQHPSDQAELFGRGVHGTGTAPGSGSGNSTRTPGGREVGEAAEPDEGDTSFNFGANVKSQKLKRGISGLGKK